MTWEANLVAAHHRLAVTPMYFEDGSGNTEWMAAHGRSTPRSLRRPAAPSSNGSAASSTTLPSCTGYWAGNLPHHPARAHVADEHKAIFDAALARKPTWPSTC